MPTLRVAKSNLNDLLCELRHLRHLTVYPCVPNAVPYSHNSDPNDTGYLDYGPPNYNNLWHNLRDADGRLQILLIDYSRNLSKDINSKVWWDRHLRQYIKSIQVADRPAQIRNLKRLAAPCGIFVSPRKIPEGSLTPVCENLPPNQAKGSRNSSHRCTKRRRRSTVRLVSLT